MSDPRGVVPPQRARARDVPRWHACCFLFSTTFPSSTESFSYCSSPHPCPRASSRSVRSFRIRPASPDSPPDASLGVARHRQHDHEGRAGVHGAADRHERRRRPLRPLADGLPATHQFVFRQSYREDSALRRRHAAREIRIVQADVLPCEPRPPDASDHRGHFRQALLARQAAGAQRVECTRSQVVWTWVQSCMAASP